MRRNRRGWDRISKACQIETLEFRRLMSANPAGFTQTINYVENTPAVQLAGLGVTAADASDNITATLTLADPAAGSLGGMPTNGGGKYDANTGVWSITGDVYSVNFALQNAWFYPAAGYTQNTTISAQVTDNTDNTAANPGTISLNASTYSGPVMHQIILPAGVSEGGDENSGFGIANDDGYGDGKGSQFVPYITDLVADPSSTIFQMSISAAHTSLTLGGDMSGISFITGTGADDHAMVFTGTLDAINTAMAGVYGQFDPHYFGQESVLFTVSDLGKTGQGAAPQTASCTFDIDIDNWPDAPVAVAGSDQNAVEGALAHFDASGSYDYDNDPLTYTWDFGDGTQGSGVSPTHVYANEGLYAVTLTVDDGTGWTQDGVSTMQVTVTNAAPTGSLSGSTVGVRGQMLGFTGTAADAGVNDQLQVSWDFGDGQTIDFAPVSAGSLAPTHVYTAKGNFVVTMTMRDDASATSVFTQNVSIADVTLQQDPLDPNKSALLVGGTTGNDTILITQAGNGRLRATINGVTNGKTYQPTGHIIVYALGGSNLVDISDKITTDAALYGGSGKDTLDGGGGNDILLGRKGNDKLIGRSGRDLLIGGAGSDTLDAGDGDDCLVAGTWSAEYDDTALAAVMNQWTRMDLNYLQRVKILRGDTPGLSSADRLNASTVSDDATADVLSGGAGRDWFLAIPSGPAKDLFAAASDELVTPVS